VFGRRKHGETRGRRGDAGAAPPADPGSALATAERLRQQVAGDADPALLDRALAAATAAVDANRDDVDGRAVALSMVCVLQRTRAARGGDLRALRAAVEAGRAGYALTAASGTGVRGRCASALSTTLLDLYQAQRDVAAIDEAVELSRRTVDDLDPDDGEYVGMLSNLGNALLLASQAHGDADLLNESVAVSRMASREIGPTDDRLVTVSVNLASALSQQAITTMSIAPLQEAQRLVHTALRHVDARSPNRRTVLEFAAKLDRAMTALGQ
jgi:hypothetical protein